MTFKERAKELVSKMTIGEKMSQMRYDSPAIERLGIPAYNWWNEALHGYARSGTATVFPQAIGMAAMFDDELLERIGDAIATEGRAKYNAHTAEGDRTQYKGLTFWSPNINIFRDPRWGRGHETYGEDPYLTARLGKAFINGLQGHGDTLKAAACAAQLLDWYYLYEDPDCARGSAANFAAVNDLSEDAVHANGIPVDFDMEDDDEEGEELSFEIGSIELESAASDEE